MYFFIVQEKKLKLKTKSKKIKKIKIKENKIIEFKHTITKIKSFVFDSDIVMLSVNGI